MQNYSFEFTYVPSESTPQVPTAPSTNIPSAPDTSPQPEGQSFGQGFAQGIEKRATNYVTQQALAPLNQATGGLATPTFNLAKGIITGAGSAVIGGAVFALALNAIQTAISKIEERVAKNEAKAAEMNERDNLLIKAGIKTTATFYSGSFNGVKSTERKF